MTQQQGDGVVAGPVGRRAGRGQVTSYGDRRCCAEPGCATVLSRYNSTAYCATHDPDRDRARPHRR